MASDLEEALGEECKRLAARVETLETEGREEFHRIVDQLTAENKRMREALELLRDNPYTPRWILNRVIPGALQGEKESNGA